MAAERRPQWIARELGRGDPARQCEEGAERRHGLIRVARQGIDLRQVRLDERARRRVFRRRKQLERAPPGPDRVRRPSGSRAGQAVVDQALRVIGLQLQLGLVKSGVLAAASTIQAAQQRENWSPAGRISIRGRREKAVVYSLREGQGRRSRRYGTPWSANPERSAP